MRSITETVRQGSVVIAMACALVVAPTPALAQQADEERSGGSLAAQLLSAADESLGEDATVAVLRAYDRGYELLQIVEAMLEGLFAEDGTITDDEGVPVEPFRAPSNLIEGDGEGGGAPGAVAAGFGPNETSGEQIAIAALETGIAKTTKQIDKEVDLEARAERAGASHEDLFTMLTAIALMAKGYSPEQIIVDGFASPDGIEIQGPGFDPVIVDEKGKVLRPDGVEESPDTEEAAGQVDLLVSDIADLVGGLDPRIAASEAFRTDFRVKLVITVTDEGASTTITAKGDIGRPKSRDLRAFVIGEAKGDVEGGGVCAIGDFIDENVPYDVSGTAELGLSGPLDGDRVSLKAGVVDANLNVAAEGGNTICGDLVRKTTEPVVELLTVGPFDLRLRGGATDTVTGSFFEARYKAKLTLG